MNFSLSTGETEDLICFSHLRWDFVVQRPQHLMTRFARSRRVFFVEEPLEGDQTTASLEVSARPQGIEVVRLRIPRGTSPDRYDRLQREWVLPFLKESVRPSPCLWFYTPMAVVLAAELTASAVIYDCMDELSQFDGAPAGLPAAEEGLLARADLVFTGGRSLFEAKRSRHPSVHLFPSSVDVAHFSQARRPQPDPLDQRDLGFPRLGYCGVIDERLDQPLLATLAAEHPAWQFVLLGPSVKVDPQRLPRAPNLHYLGAKPYPELPNYLAGWQVALLPFALNRSTRYISPTKTPEYLAAGLPVVSTPIRDVVDTYSEAERVRIGGNTTSFAAAIQASLDPATAADLERVDQFLARGSWDATFGAMDHLLQQLLLKRRRSGHRTATPMGREAACTTI